MDTNVHSVAAAHTDRDNRELPAPIRFTNAVGQNNIATSLCRSSRPLDDSCLDLCHPILVDVQTGSADPVVTKIPRKRTAGGGFGGRRLYDRAQHLFFGGVEIHRDLKRRQRVGFRASA